MMSPKEVVVSEITLEFFSWLSELSIHEQWMIVIVGAGMFLLGYALLTWQEVRCGIQPLWLQWWLKRRGQQPSLTISSWEPVRPSFRVFVFGISLLVFGVFVAVVGIALLPS